MKVEPSLIFESTDACNLRCAFCYEQGRRARGHVPLDTFRAVLARYRPFYLQITGGEPMLHPAFRELMRCALSRVPVVQVTTNGTRLEEEGAFLAGLRRKPFVGVSVDLPGPGHDRVRKRKGLFKEIEAGLGELKARGVPVAVSTTIFGPGDVAEMPEGNGDAVEDLIAFSADSDLPINLQPCAPAPESVRRDLGEKLRASTYPKLVNSPPYREMLVRGHDGRCRFNWTNVSVGTDGAVLPTRPGNCYFCNDCAACYYSCVWEPTLLTSRHGAASARHFLAMQLAMSPTVSRAKRALENLARR